MFCYSAGRFISNHTNVGYNFVKVDGVSDLLIMETICSKSLACVSFLSKRKS